MTSNEATDAGAEPGARLLRAWERARGAGDPVASLEATRVLFGELRDWQSELVRAALARDATWEDVGGALGTTRQAAWARFRDVAEAVEDRSIPSPQEVKAMTQREHDELRTLSEKVKEFDRKWRERQAELTAQARALERERADERRQLRAEIRGAHASLRAAIRELRAPSA